MPRSRASWMVAMDSLSSDWPYIPDMPMHPRAMAETVGPLVPSWRVGSVALVIG